MAFGHLLSSFFFAFFLSFTRLVPSFVLENVQITSSISDTSSSSDSSGSEYDSYYSNAKGRQQRLTSEKREALHPHSTRRRGDHSKDLKQIIEDLEQSDYGNYGSWGNFKNGAKPVPLQHPQPQPSRSQHIQSDDFYELGFTDEIHVDHSQSNPRSFPQSQWSNPQVSQPPLPPLPPLPPYAYNQGVPRFSSQIALNRELVKSLDPKRMLQFRSVMKVTAILVIGAVLSYLSVVPRQLALVEYNEAYKDTLVRLLGSFMFPMVVMLTVFDEGVNINNFIDTLTSSFVWGYGVIAAGELVLATLARLLILRWLEPNAFALCPKVPAILLPWVLSVQGYFPSRVTLALFSVVVNCGLAPVVEEWAKLQFLRLALVAQMRSDTDAAQQTQTTGRRHKSGLRSWLLARLGIPIRTIPEPARSSSLPAATSMQAPDYHTTVMGGMQGHHQMAAAGPRNAVPPPPVPPPPPPLAAVGAAAPPYPPPDYPPDYPTYPHSYQHAAALPHSQASRYNEMPMHFDGAAAAVPVGGIAIPAASVLSPLSVKSYVTFMTAVAMGLKIADNTRRILLYSSSGNKNKMFFAIARGVFPVQELCGAMTALALAKRELLGHKEWDFRTILPAVMLHAMANFRGTKPFFVWNSNRPWDEIQLQAWNTADNATPQQLVIAGVFNVMWFMVLMRSLVGVLRDCVVLSREYASRVEMAVGDAAAASFSGHSGYSGYNSRAVTVAHSQQGPPAWTG